MARFEARLRAKGRQKGWKRSKDAASIEASEPAIYKSLCDKQDKTEKGAKSTLEASVRLAVAVLNNLITHICFIISKS